MYLWFLYLLSATSHALLSSESNLESTVQWNPIETFSELNGYSVVEGDILVNFEDDSKNVIRSKAYLWENGIIPYTWGDEFDIYEKRQILEAMRVIESKTCIRFVERKNENSYIKFQKQKEGCYASIGRLISPEGPLPVNLESPKCLRKSGLVVHELLHVVGLFHEQSRPDRDDFVDIHWENVDPQKKYDFRKRSSEQVNTYGVPYDYGSIMHFGNYDFSFNGKPTITAKVRDTNVRMGQREEPSDADIEKVLRMYKCNMTKIDVDGKEPAREGYLKFRIP